MALFIVCAIDVIDWFDFYKFEVSKKVTGVEYQVRVMPVISLSIFFATNLVVMYHGDKKVEDQQNDDDVMMNF